jgi:hypothetical protein
VLIIIIIRKVVGDDNVVHPGEEGTQMGARIVLSTGSGHVSWFIDGNITMGAIEKHTKPYVRVSICTTDA